MSRETPATKLLLGRVQRKTLEEMRKRHPMFYAALWETWRTYYYDQGFRSNKLWQLTYTAVRTDVRETYPDEWVQARGRIRPALEAEIGWVDGRVLDGLRRRGLTPSTTGHTVEQATTEEQT